MAIQHQKGHTVPKQVSQLDDDDDDDDDDDMMMMMTLQSPLEKQMLWFYSLRTVCTV